MRPWRILDRVQTPDGVLDLRRRGDREFLITIGGRVLMTSAAHRSEVELARLAAVPLAGNRRPQVLLGGLGMGFTLRALLDELPPAARVTVVDLNARVVGWCRGPLAAIAGHALDDRRVTVEITDVARLIADGAPRWDAIVLDLYEGPHAATNGTRDPIYGARALRRSFNALRPGGALAIWSEEPDRPFEVRFAAAGFEVQRHRAGRGGRAHVVYVGLRR